MKPRINLKTNLEIHEIKKQLKILKKKYIIEIIVMFAGYIFEIISIFLLVFLTGAKDLFVLAKMDWIYFIAFISFDIILFIGIFIIVSSGRKSFFAISRLHKSLYFSLITYTPVLSGNPIAVYTNLEYAGRITVFGFPNCKEVYYTVELINSDLVLKKLVACKNSTFSI